MNTGTTKNTKENCDTTIQLRCSRNHHREGIGGSEGSGRVFGRPGGGLGGEVVWQDATGRLGGHGGVGRLVVGCVWPSRKSYRLATCTRSAEG